jgi:hypothetical protein
VTPAKLCPNDHPMHVEVAGRVVGAVNGEQVRLWFCDTCDHADAELRQRVGRRRVLVASAR